MNRIEEKTETGLPRQTALWSRLSRGAFTMLAIAGLTFASASAYAICGAPPSRPVATHTSWSPQLRGGQSQGARFVPANDVLDIFDPIVGMWHVKFVVKGNNSTVPNDTEFDAGYSVWHGDGTEITDSGGRPPQSGDFCMGVWQKIGERTYKLNHFAASWTPTGSSFAGPSQIQEHLTLDPSGNSYIGTFIVDSYSEVNGVLNPIPVAHFQGEITGTRITVNTPVQAIF
jgi:hypothetical protein